MECRPYRLTTKAQLKRPSKHGRFKHSINVGIRGTNRNNDRAACNKCLIVPGCDAAPGCDAP